MKQYEIVYRDRKHIITSYDTLLKTLIDFCNRQEIDPNDVTSCVLITDKSTVMGINTDLKVLNNHMLCLSGKMVSKPKTKEVIEALQITINEINKNK